MVLGGLRIPPSSVVDYGASVIASANEPQEMVEGLVDVSTGSVLVVGHPNNNGIVYMGFDEDVTVNTGIPVQAGSGVTIELDITQQNIYIVSSQSGDEVRYVATN